MSLRDLGLSTTLVLSHRRAIDLGAGNRRQNREALSAVARLLDGAATGDVDSAVLVANQATTPAAAGATVIVSGGSGTLTTTINGVNVTASGAGIDAQDAAAIATAVNASSDALVQGFVRGTNISDSVSLTATTAGSTLTINTPNGSFRFTATSAASSTLGEFSIAGNDAADATALAAAINIYPVLNSLVRAEAVSSAVSVYVLDGTTAGYSMFPTGSGISAANGFASTARAHIYCLLPGAIGNAITFAASGTGTSVANSNTRLVGGEGGLTGTYKLINAGGGR